MPISATDVMLGCLVVVGLGILVLAYEILKQQGRMLLRLDTIEGRLGSGEAAAIAGLGVGEPFGEFAAFDFDGKAFDTKDLRNKRALIVHWSPHCGFCERIAPELAQLDTAFRDQDVDLVFVTASQADIAENRRLAARFGLSGRFVYQEAGRKFAAFDGKGTPVAYLIDRSGRVAQPIALGADQVPVLARLAVGKATVAEYQACQARPEGTCRQPGSGAADTKALPIAGAGPGTELKRLLAKVGLAVTPDCPCHEHAAVMDRRGADWCAANLDTIVGWMRAESRRRGVVFSETGARLLARRAIANARRESVTAS